jgi:PPOX class probable F420-dependent enzyme
MPNLPPEARVIIESGRLAHFATINPDGTPQVTCIWVGLDGDEIVSGHLPRNQKVKNVERDPRVVISMEGADDNDELGLREYVVVRGLARVEEGGAPELLQRLAHVYLGPDVKFPPIDDPPPGYVIRTTPERIGGLGPWTGQAV